MQSIGIIKIVLITATGKLTKNISVEESYYDCLCFFIIFLNTSEAAKKLAHESPCLINKEVNPVYRSRKEKFLL